LRNTKIRRVQKPPVGLIAHFFELAFQAIAIILKNSGEEPPHIFDHNRLGPDFIDQANGGGKEVTLILVTQLLSRNGKGRAWQAARK
jgi:hypothetical protein